MKIRKLIIAVLTMGIACGLVGLPTMAAEVSQGKCVQFDEPNKRITIESYDIQFSSQFPYGRPTGEKEVFDVSKAAIGIRPEAGDILRLAWVNDGNTVKSALKVMNVTKQDLRKK
ncbi:MAG: hypothetical protein V2I40_00550 [Desulfobacteraceae bacterium]|jgi:hypothetical protein|nr:hypothetical protein [Desulfobacteraceae bacterium]